MASCVNRLAGVWDGWSAMSGRPHWREIFVIPKAQRTREILDNSLGFGVLESKGEHKRMWARNT